MAENNEKKIELEEGEIMRISVRDYDPETGNYAVAFAANGNSGVMIHAILDILKDEFGVQCVTGMPMMGLTICIPRYDEEDEEGEETEETSAESEE